MARKKRASAVALPDVGSVFLTPLSDGRFGVCRVIRRDDTSFGAPCVLVVASAWIGSNPPGLDEPLLLRPLVLNHHNWKKQIEANWVSDAVPDNLRLLGVIPPTRAEKRLECHSFSGWGNFPLQVLLQWRWDHEREAVLEEDRIENELRQRELQQQAVARQQQLDALTLPKLRKKRRFNSWKGAVSPAAIRACRQTFDEAIDALLSIDGKPKKRDVVAVLKRCVERLNELDGEFDHLIETIEREDLCEEILEITHACGFPELGDIADRWREW